MNKMLIRTSLDQRMMLSPQLLQSIALLQYTNLDLKELFDKTLEENIFIEEHDEKELKFKNLDSGTYEKTLWHESTVERKYGDARSCGQVSDDFFYENYSKPKTLHDYLLEQTLLCQFSKEQQLVAEAIIDAIDDNAQLSISLEEIHKSHHVLFSIPFQTFPQVLSIIQGFDPAGVGWRDNRECLLIQLRNFIEQDKMSVIAQEIVTNYFEFIHVGLSKKHLDTLGISHSEYIEAISLILSLDPKPARQFSQEYNFNIEPDLIIKKHQGRWNIFLNDAVIPRVQLSKSYQSLLQSLKTHDSYPALKEKLHEAQSLLTGLKNRNETLMRVGTFIIKNQEDFLDYGQEYMKPLIISDIASVLHLHASTISRITTGKYMSTPRGVFELKYFFSSHVNTDSGEQCSATKVKMHIKNIIAEENKLHPYSDIQLASMLKDKSIHIARRTIAKYRDALKIPPAYLRAAKLKHTQLFSA